MCVNFKPRKYFYPSKLTNIICWKQKIYLVTFIRINFHYDQINLNCV